MGFLTGLYALIHFSPCSIYPSPALQTCCDFWVGQQKPPFSLGCSVPSPRPVSSLPAGLLSAPHSQGLLSLLKLPMKSPTAQARVLRGQEDFQTRRPHRVQVSKHCLSPGSPTSCSQHSLATGKLTPHDGHFATRKLWSSDSDYVLLSFKGRLRLLF